MPVELELLAPAKNAEIGIAAIDCGADAVYIAGPSFGARQAAGNSLKDIETLCSYAHKFGARIFVTINTILFDNELNEAKALLNQVKDAGADAIIVQDMAIVEMVNSLGIDEYLPIHASTQCAIQNAETAKFLENLGFSRLVLEREMSLDHIKEIKNSVNCELEFFVHGALCVCYSGNCYISEYISGRSANRGSCMQACRSRYDLIDSKGKVLVKNKALLSLKDYNLLNHLEELAEAGVNSFKIEGRLKNISYVKNVVREYSIALNRIVDKYPDKYCRASYGKVTKGFIPDLDKTFNRGYTSLFIDGKRGKWASMDAPKGMGEEIGIVSSIRNLGKDEMEITLKSKISHLKLSNGDGFSFYTDNDIIGFRGDVCNGLTIRCKRIKEIFKGAIIFRNLSVDFEKALTSNTCVREIDVNVDLDITTCDEGIRIKANATSEDGRNVEHSLIATETANNADRMRQIIENQISKKSNIYNFSLRSLNYNDVLPFLSAKDLNSLRRDLADKLDSLGCIAKPLSKGRRNLPQIDKPNIDYKYNIANSLADKLMQEVGAKNISPAFEISHQKDIELMRTKYCIRYEIGLCPVYQKAKESGPLFLVNNGRTFPLRFDCKHCEMVVEEPKD